MSSVAFTPEKAPAGDKRAFKAIAVPIHDLPCDTTALDVAAELARTQGAHMHVIQIVALPSPVADTWALMPNPDFTQLCTRIRASASTCAAGAQRKLEASGVAGEIRSLEAIYTEPADLAATAARHCDLAVLARPSHARRDGSTVHGYFAALLMESARPVMVVPADHPVESFRHVLIAWRETRECARALRDALPFLEAAGSVDLLVVDPKATPLETADDVGTTAMQFLVAHGIDAHRIAVASDGRSVGATILDEARQRHADLIVAGGYGHSRFREWAIGGTTRHLFFEATIPVLYSH